MMRKRRNNPARTTRPFAGRRRAAFTLIELLMVIGIIILILSIIIVAVNAAMRTAQSTNTQALMTSINKGLVQFQSDLGYLPPVLDDDRSYVEPPTPPETESASGFSAYFGDVQDWNSITTLPEYLIGYGDATEDGYGRVMDQAGFPGVDFSMNETDGPLGIRHPGTDGYWGVSPSSNGGGTLQARRDALGSQAGQRFRQGRSYGPYIELRDERLLAAIVGQNPDGSYQTALPGEANYDPDAPKAIVDYWGQPIRYFRRPYVPGMPNQDYRRGMYTVDSGGNAVEINRNPTLSDVIVLRPWSVNPGQEVDGAPDGLPFNPNTGDTTTSRALHAASFALFSSGPNRRLNPNVRVDEMEFNRDNLVEVGR